MGRYPNGIIRTITFPTHHPFFANHIKIERYSNGNIRTITFATRINANPRAKIIKVLLNYK